MKVKEIKAKIPKADIYELNPNSTYLIVYDMNLVSRNDVIDALKNLPSKGAALGAYGKLGEVVRILEITQ